MDEDKQYFDEKFNEIPQEVLEKASAFLIGYIPAGEQILIIEEIKEKGLMDWAIPHHSFWGMSIRNNLREAGLTDDLLPDKNWDDYYIQVIEYALGLRKKCQRCNNTLIKVKEEFFCDKCSFYQ